MVYSQKLRRNKMKIFLITFLLILSSCAGIPAKKSETKLIGTTLPDIISCAGKPSSITAINHNDVVLQYDQSGTTQPNFNIGGIHGVSFGLGGIGNCSMMARFHNGYLISIHYIGQTWTFGGAMSSCTPIINSCYYRNDHTSIPDDYNQFQILGVKQP